MFQSLTNGVNMSKKEFADLLKEANTLLDEIEQTVEHMFAEAIKAQQAVKLAA